MDNKNSNKGVAQSVINWEMGILWKTLPNQYKYSKKWGFLFTYFKWILLNFL